MTNEPKRTFTFRLDIEVHDPAALAAAAEERAVAGGMAVADWRAMRGDDPLAVDLQMLLDPGQSPPGCEIIESDVSESDFE